ncbi:MAG: FHA domain-containing protein [Saprospiraceae bacterium]
MLRCPNCNYLNEDDAEKCVRCNESLGRGPTNLRQGTNVGGGNPEKKTQIGATPSSPFLDSSANPTPSPKKMIVCRNCNYPNIASATICANCNQSLLSGTDQEVPDQSNVEKKNPPKVVRSPQKTVQLNQIGGLAGASGVQGFRLLEEGGKQVLEFQQDSVDLNREDLDKNNMAISGQAHANIEFEDGQWYITDKSSNQATFIQVTGKMPLTAGMVIIFGNKMYRFEPIE